MTRTALMVAGLTVLALALRLVLLRDSLLGDELILFRAVHDRPLGDTLHVIRETEKTPPLHFLLAWAAARVGDPTLTIRLPSLLAGVALVPGVFLLGRETVSRRAGLIAAAIAALQPFAIFYATEARAYALIALLALASTLCLLRALDTGRVLWWIAYAAAVLAAAYTHYIAAFVLVAQAGWALWVHRDRLRELLVVHGAILLGYLPWLPSFLVQRSHAGDEASRIAQLAPPSPGYFLRANAQVLFGEPFVSLRAVPGRVALVALLAICAAGLVTVLARVARGARPAPRTVLVVLLALATPAGIAVLSLPPDQSFLLPRNMSASAPALAVCLGALIAALGRRAAPIAAAVALAALAVGVVGAFQPEHRRSDYRAAARWVQARAQPADPVIQHLFVAEGDPLADVLRINFSRPQPVLPAGGAEEDAAWARARETGRAFVVYSLPGAFKRARHLERFDGPGDAFELRAEQRYAGLEDLLVGEYRLRDR